MKVNLATDARILIVDDETELVHDLQQSLSVYFGEVSGATSAELALSHLQFKKFDVILTDMRMPGVNGLSLIDSVLRAFPLMPIIVYTANPDDEGLLSALQTKLFDLIEKPCRIEVLANRIRNALLLPKFLEVMYYNFSKSATEEKLIEFRKLSQHEQIDFLMSELPKVEINSFLPA